MTPQDQTGRAGRKYSYWAQGMDHPREERALQNIDGQHPSSQTVLHGESALQEIKQINGNK